MLYYSSFICDKMYEVRFKPVVKAAIREISKQEKWECDALAVPNLVSFTVIHFFLVLQVIHFDECYFAF